MNFGMVCDWWYTRVVSFGEEEKLQNTAGDSNFVVVSNIVYFHRYLGKIPILTNIFQRGPNHQPEIIEWDLTNKVLNPK